MFTEFEAKVLKCYYSEPLMAILKAYHSLQDEHSNDNMSAFFKCLEANEVDLEHSLKLLKHVGVAGNNPTRKHFIDSFKKSCMGSFVSLSSDAQGVSELQKAFTDIMRSHTTAMLQKRDRLDTELIEMNKESAERQERLKGLLSEKKIVENIKNAVEEKRQHKS